VGVGSGDFKFEIWNCIQDGSDLRLEVKSEIEVSGKKSGANMYRNETALDKGGLAAARVVLLWS
jgi:hypothetical protein